MEGEIKPELAAVQVRVSNSRQAMAAAADNFYHHPSSKLMLTGVTGTDGKTSTCRLIHSILSKYGSTGLMGTVGNIILGHHQEAVRTTPEAPEINHKLDLLLQGGAYAAVLEVSSHALAMHRTDKLDFDIAVFTNLSPEHLDFHLNMEDYFQAKARLFTELKPEAQAVINIDDSAGERLKELISCRVTTYSFQDKAADVYGELIYQGFDGTRMNIYFDNEVIDIHSHLFGMPNAYNVLAGSAAMLRANCTIDAIRLGIADVSGVEGRYERIDCGEFYTIIDYAHTEQAISSLLKVLRLLTMGKLHIVFGCGGDRDRKKRPLMGAAAEELADYVYITSDNPRRERPEAIIEDILGGLKDRDSVKVIVDRREAIQAALNSAQAGDAVEVVGKGHEKFQEIDGVFHHFNDREVVVEWLVEKGIRGRL